MGRRREGRPGLRPSSEVFDRIRWDPSLDERAFVVGYEDRFSGVEELPLVELVARGDVPWHRVRQVRVGELVVWDRAARIDRLFGSGDTAAEPSRIQAAIADVVATTRSREPSELIDVAVHRFDAARGVWARAADVAHEESSARRSLSVLTFNVLFDRYDGGALHTARRVPALLERLRREKADVIALQEVTPSLLASLLAEPWVQREYWVSDGPDAATIQPYGVLLLARAPFTARLRPGRKGRGKRVLYGELSARGRRLLVAVLHLTSDRSQEAAVRRAAELDVIADDLARWSGARLVLGDFNAEGAGLDARLRAAGLIDLWRSLRPDDTGPTFDPGRNRLARLSSRRPEARRLDRVLLGYGDDPTWLRPVDVALFATKPEVPTPDGLLPLSDHWGLRARLELIGGLPAPAVDAKPTHRTALALIPPRELWPAIQALRSAHDRAYRRWMPHVTLLYGFVPADALPDAAAAIEAALVDTPAFEVSLETIRSFDRHRGATLWLDPACAPSDALRSLQRRLQGLFPRCDEVSNRGPHGYTPHLTVGQQPADAAAEARARWQAAWRPLAFTAASVAILRRDGDAPFHVARVIPLAPASTIKVDAPALPEAWARRRDAIAQAWSEVVGDVRSIVHVVGSHRLGAAGPGADLDLVAVAPARVDLATLFADVQRALAAAGHEVQGRAILDAVAPRLAMTLDGGAVDLQAIQCPKGHAAPETRDELAALVEGGALDESSRAAALAVLDAEALLDHAARHGGVPRFSAALRGLRRWAAARDVDSNGLGYPGGLAWAVLLADVAADEPVDPTDAAPARTLLRAGLESLARRTPRDWGHAPIGLSASPGQPDTGDAMVVLAPAPPRRNCTARATRTIVAVVEAELEQAAASIADDDDARLLAPVEPLSSHAAFVVVTVAADTRAALDELIGRVMGRAASLVRLIERALPDCQLRPYASWRRRAHEPAAILRWGVDAAELGRSWRTPATALAWCRSIVDEGERGSVRVELLSADGLPLDGACAPTLD